MVFRKANASVRALHWGLLGLNSVSDLFFPVFGGGDVLVDLLVMAEIVRDVGPVGKLGFEGRLKAKKTLEVFDFGGDEFFVELPFINYLDNLLE